MSFNSVYSRAHLCVLAAFLACLFAVAAQGKIDGITGPGFNLTAKSWHISTGDGLSVYCWGYANGPGGQMQYPGPTLIVDQGDTVTITLTNELDEATSILFPGQEGVTATGLAGILTAEAGPSGSATYTFVANRPGTFLYHSGTNPEIQVEMGLVGAIIVRPTGFNPAAPTAYGDPASAYDREYLYLLSEMDPRIHQVVEFQGTAALADKDYLSDYFPNFWFINGRNAPDCLFPDDVPWLPAQPYNALTMMHPGDRVLMRVIGAGRDLHPFHHHGNHARIIARDGVPLESVPGNGIDLDHEVFTISSVPGQTVDAIFGWTGAGMGWDIYGHKPGDPLEPFEDPNDHGKPFPVNLPENQNLTFGGFFSGSPFLGNTGALPPGEGGLNPWGAFMYPWHSHTEKEIVNFDIFIGGMLTLLVIVPHGTPIPE